LKRKAGEEEAEKKPRKKTASATVVSKAPSGVSLEDAELLMSLRGP